MAAFFIWVTLSNNQRIKLAECEERKYAELLIAALKSYTPPGLPPVQETAQKALDASVDTFKLEDITVTWKAEKETHA
jgi:hypothetical protein